jgi:hypothetical protein
MLLAKNPRDRPSVNAILRIPFVCSRIRQFLSATLFSDEFSHTVIHAGPALKPSKDKVKENEKGKEKGDDSDSSNSNNNKLIKNKRPSQPQIVPAQQRQQPAAQPPQKQQNQQQQQQQQRPVAAKPAQQDKQKQQPQPQQQQQQRVAGKRESPPAPAVNRIGLMEKAYGVQQKAKVKELPRPQSKDNLKDNRALPLLPEVKLCPQPAAGAGAGAAPAAGAKKNQRDGRQASPPLSQAAAEQRRLAAKADQEYEAMVKLRHAEFAQRRLAGANIKARVETELQGVLDKQQQQQQRAPVSLLANGQRRLPALPADMVRPVPLQQQQQQQQQQQAAIQPAPPQQPQSQPQPPPDRQRIVDEFLDRKRVAEEYKLRGGAMVRKGEKRRRMKQRWELTCFCRTAGMERRPARLGEADQG